MGSSIEPSASVDSNPQAVIVDFGLGNLFSVRQACLHVGIRASISSSPADIKAADVVILPGVGAFGDAMRNLRRLGLVEVLHEVAESGTPMAGICLGIQLLMTRSEEFGDHEGLGLVPGVVKRFCRPCEDGRVLKVPQVQWNQVWPVGDESCNGWDETLLREVKAGEYFYFVHSYHVVPDDPAVVTAKTRYGDCEFCSALQYKNISAFQFHPERSGEKGLAVYREIARISTSQRKGAVR